MSQEFVTIGYRKDGRRYFVEVPTSEFVALYQDTTLALVDIAQKLGVNINGIVSASKKLKLDARYGKYRHSKNYARVDIERLREVMGNGATYEAAARELGETRHIVTRMVERYNIPSRYTDKKLYKRCETCKDLALCHSIEPTGAVLLCEVMIDDELPPQYFERDSAPSIGYSAMPYCKIMR